MNEQIQSFCRYWEDSHPEGALRRAISQAFPHLELEKVPIDLPKLANRRNVQEIVYSDLETDGSLFPTKTGNFIIKVNNRLSKARKRFTIAHELIHTLFLEAELDQLDGGRKDNCRIFSRRDDPDEERLCNQGAAEILMPERQFCGLLAEEGPAARNILLLARRFGVSLRACSRRVLQYYPKLAVALLEHHSQRGALASRWIEGCHVNDGKRQMIINEDLPAYKVLEGESGYRGRLWLPLDGPIQDYFVDAEEVHYGGNRHLFLVYVLYPQPHSILNQKQIQLGQKTQKKLF